MSRGEFVNLQIGHYANYVGTHWWNLQESSFIYDAAEIDRTDINHDVLFREGKTVNGQVTYTPRLIAFDLKDSLNTLKQEGILYGSPDPLEFLPLWSGRINKYETEPSKKNQFLKDLEEDNECSDMAENSNQSYYESKTNNDIDGSNTQAINRTDVNLDHEVSVWSDFLRIHLHPKSLCIVPQYMHNASYDPFDIFSYGCEAYEKIVNEYEDKLHFFTEECDQLQGFHVLVDMLDGFGGLGYKIMEDLRSEFRSKAILNINTLPVTNPSQVASNAQSIIINTVLSISHFSHHCDALLPLSLNSANAMDVMNPVDFSDINYNALSMYHSSSIIAAALDTATLPYRLHTNTVPASHIIDTLTEVGRKVLSLSTCFPFPIRRDCSLTSLFQSMNGKIGQILSCLSPEHNSQNLRFSRYVTLRGISSLPLHSKKLHATTNFKDKVEDFSQCSTARDVLQHFLYANYPNSLSLCSVVDDACHVEAPFPAIFTKNISADGWLEDGCKSKPNLGINKVAVMTSLESSCGSQNYLKSLITQAKKVDFRRHYKFKEAGIEEDTYFEALENIRFLAGAYDLFDENL